MSSSNDTTTDIERQPNGMMQMPPATTVSEVFRRQQETIGMPPEQYYNPNDPEEMETMRIELAMLHRPEETRSEEEMDQRRYMFRIMVALSRVISTKDEPPLPKQQVPLALVPIEQLLSKGASTPASSCAALGLCPEERTCAVCLEEIDALADVYDLTCKHPYHPACLEEWFNTKAENRGTCPQDRQQICPPANAVVAADAESQEEVCGVRCESCGC